MTVDLISDKAFSTSEIEEEFLNRESLPFSIRRQLNLATDNRRIPPAEQGIAQMRGDLYRHFATPLTNELLFRWQEFLMNSRRDLKDLDSYRLRKEPMLIVAGPVHEPKVHLEAPQARALAQEGAFANA